MRQWCALVLAAHLFGCGSKKEPPRPSEPPPAPVVGDDDGDGPAQPITPDFPTGTRSLELTRTTAVRLEPGDDSKRIGTVAVDTRVRWTGTAPGKGCKKPWVELVPRGWVCSEYLTPTKKAAMGREVPMLDRGELVPGIYGKVTAPNSVTYALEQPKKDPKKKTPKPTTPKGPVTSTSDVDDTAPRGPEPKMIEDKPLVGSVTVRQWQEITVAGKAYWKVSQKDNEYVLASAIRTHKPSLYNGARLGDDTGWTVPIAFVWPKVAGYQSTYTMNKANGGGTNRQLTARTPVQILDSVADPSGKVLAYKIGEAEWIRAQDVRVFTPVAPPKLLTKGERWIDVDLESQILVAYEGDLPVFATMISSGTKETPTDTGEYRMWLKESEADMKNLKSEDPYSVATVPWTQFFSPENGLALHTAYWHDQFGTKKSHGCVNLSPKDARWLYFWSDPQVPPGWTMAAGVIEAPGSIVRVRSKDEPNPPPKGYAKKVVEARQQNAPR